MGFDLTYFSWRTWQQVLAIIMSYRLGVYLWSSVDILITGSWGGLHDTQRHICVWYEGNGESAHGLWAALLCFSHFYEGATSLPVNDTEMKLVIPFLCIPRSRECCACVIIVSTHWITSTSLNQVSKFQMKIRIDLSSPLYSILAGAARIDTHIVIFLSSRRNKITISTAAVTLWSSVTREINPLFSWQSDKLYLSYYLQHINSFWFWEHK